MDARWPLRLAPLGELTMGARLWRLEGQLMATVVAKVTASFSVDGPMTMMPPAPVRVDDEHEGGHPMRSVVGARELAPQLYQVDVLMVGHAHAPEGGSKVSARLALEQGGRWPLNKLVSIYGDRDEAGNAQLFDKIRVSWERAYGGIGHAENPLGTGFGGATKAAPNIIYADGRETPASFSPVPPTFPARKRLLGATSKKALGADIAEIPATFDWSYFQAAPADQRLEMLHGNEWLQIEGMHPSLQKIRTRLPGVAVVTKVYGHDAIGAPNAIPMRPDMLLLEPNELRASLVYRGSFPVMDASALPKAIIAAGIETPEEPMMWPEDTAELEILPNAVPDVNGGAPRAAPAPVGDAHPLQGTFAMSPEAASKAGIAALPFGGSAGPPPGPPPPPVPPPVSTPHPLEGTISITDDTPLGGPLPFGAGKARPPKAPGSAPKEIPGAPWASTPAAPVVPPDPSATGTVDPRTGKPRERTVALEDESALAALRRIREEDAAKNEADTQRLQTLDADTQRLVAKPEANTERLSAPTLLAEAGQTADLSAADVAAGIAAARAVAAQRAAAQRATVDRATVDRAAADKAAADKAAADKAAADKAAAKRAAAEKAAADEAAAEKAAAVEAERKRAEEEAAREKAETRRKEEAERFRKEQEEAEREAKRRAEEEAKAKADAAKKLRANMYGGFKRKG